MLRDHGDIGQNAATFSAFTTTTRSTGLVPRVTAARPTLPVPTFEPLGRSDAVAKIPVGIDDPYQLAFLRGGASEVLRLHLFELVQRGYLQVIETRKWLSTRTELAHAENPPPYEDLTGAGKDLIGLFARARQARISSSEFPEALKLICGGYRERFEETGLLRAKWPAKAIPLVAGVTGFGLVGALVGWQPAIFAGVLLAVASTAAFSRFSRMTSAGRQCLREQQAHFDFTKASAATARIDVVDPALLWGVAAFGVGILAGSPYDAFAAAVGPGANNGDSDGGGWWAVSDTSCGGSGCGGGCGGGGCGGGCGGGGCGGGCGGG